MDLLSSGRGSGGRGSSNSESGGQGVSRLERSTWRSKQREKPRSTRPSDIYRLHPRHKALCRIAISYDDDLLTKSYSLTYRNLSKPIYLAYLL